MDGFKIYSLVDDESSTELPLHRFDDAVRASGYEVSQKDLQKARIAIANAKVSSSSVNNRSSGQLLRKESRKSLTPEDIATEDSVGIRTTVNEMDFYCVCEKFRHIKEIAPDEVAKAMTQNNLQKDVTISDLINLAKSGPEPLSENEINDYRRLLSVQVFNLNQNTSVSISDYISWLLKFSENTIPSESPDPDRGVEPFFGELHRSCSAASPPAGARSRTKSPSAVILEIEKKSVKTTENEPAVLANPAVERELKLQQEIEEKIEKLNQELEEKQRLLENEKRAREKRDAIEEEKRNKEMEDALKVLQEVERRRIEEQIEREKELKAQEKLEKASEPVNFPLHPSSSPPDQIKKEETSKPRESKADENKGLGNSSCSFSALDLPEVLPVPPVIPKSSPVRAEDDFHKPEEKKSDKKTVANCCIIS